MSRYRWPRRVLFFLFFLLFLAIAGIYYDRHRTRAAGEERLAKIVTQLDATDPRWRLEEIEADLPQIPEHENSAQLVPRFKAALVSGKFEIKREDGKYISFEHEPNRFLSDDNMSVVESSLKQNDAALKIARSFDKYSKGLLYATFKPDGMSSNIDELMDLRQIFEVLRYDSLRSCKQGKPDDALRAARAILHASRIIDGESCWIAVLVRIAGDQSAVSTVNRSLALSNPMTGLVAAQEELLREAEADFFWKAARGERAFCNAMWEQVGSGKLSMADLLDDRVGARATTKPTAKQRIEEWRFRPYFSTEHATCLEFINSYYAVRKLPEEKQLGAVNAIEVPIAKKGSLAANLISTTYLNMLHAHFRIRALLRCAATGVAVERFRQSYGRWPKSLAEIPRSILPAIPNDPYDGMHLKFVKRKDGVTVYSIGRDELDDGGKFPDGATLSSPGIDLVFHLYDVAERGKPALPEPKPIEDDDESM